MPPKRKEKEGEVNGVKKNDVQLDHEHFLQAFEKPTQIYRYLRTRNMISPIFLNRNLTYMRHRMSRTNKRRKTFKIDSMLSMKTDEQKKSGTLSFDGNYLTLTFVGFFDKQAEEVEQEQSKMKVEVSLVKYSLKKRKDTADINQLPLGTVEVMTNPNDAALTRFKIPVLSIPTQKFDSDNHQTAKYSLLFKVETNNGTGVLSAVNGNDEPAAKRPKFNPKAYTISLDVFNKNGPCLLTEGEYDLYAEDATTADINALSPKKLPAWESMENFGFINTEDLDYDAYTKAPSLKFQIQWTKDPVVGLVEYKPQFSFQENGDDKENVPKLNGSSTTTTVATTAAVNGPNNNNNLVKSEPVEPKLRIVYQFVYNNNSRQQTESVYDFSCPWCSVNCQTLYPLVKHLKLCHARFVFNYLPIEGGARIDVGINDTYDGSYTGSPHDLLAPMSMSRTAGPKRRSTVTNILVCHPRRGKMSMNEFQEIEENEFESQRPYISGHNRLYYHTMTCLPILPKELDIDSEGESDPSWLQHKTTQMIDEFTDVNPGEKELMKMWNLHVMKYGFVGDIQVPLILRMFIDQHGQEILGKQLYRNFLLHMTSLYDYGLISPEVYFQCIQNLQRILKDKEHERLKMTQRLDEQAGYWTETGIHKHIEQQRLLEEKKAKEKAEEELRRQREPTPDLESFSITATDTIKASATTPKSMTRRRSAGSLAGHNFNNLVNSNHTRRSNQLLPRRRSLAGTVIPTSMIDKFEQLNPKIVLTRNKTTQMAAPRTRTSTGASQK